MIKNRLLASLDAVCFAQLAPHLERVPLHRRTILQDHYHPIDDVYFIESGVASVYARTRADGPVEVAVVGRFGLVGVAALLGAVRSPHRSLVQVPGEALRIRAADLCAAMDASPPIRRHLLSYVNALLVQNAQAALCNGRHDVEKRLCRWLLLAADRLDQTIMPITHDMLAMNLGVRRAGVTQLLGLLQKTGVIAIRRGMCEIIDRPSLERRTCECYGIIAAEYRALMARGCHGHVLPDDLARAGSALRPTLTHAPPEVASP
jgi:CRP-like cAMP-binding protein